MRCHCTFVLRKVAAQRPKQGEDDMHSKQKWGVTFTMALQCGVQTRASFLEASWKGRWECVGH